MAHFNIYYQYLARSFICYQSKEFLNGIMANEYEAYLSPFSLILFFPERDSIPTFVAIPT